MSLPERLWEVLRLDREVVAQRAAFHRAYAYLEEPPFDPRAVVELMRYGPPAGFGDRVVDLLADEGRDLAVQLTEHYPSRPRPPWVAAAEAADALRRAAIANLMLDTRAGRDDLVEAGRRYQEAGLPFGDFLLVAVGHEEGMAVPPRRQERLEPAQRRYRALTEALLADHPWPGRGQRAATPTSVAVGATSLPLSTWLRMADLLNEVRPDAPETRQRLASTLGEVALAHGRQVDFAMADRYHWDGGLWTVDPVDLDLAGALAISARVMRTRDVRPWTLDRDFSGFPPSAVVSLLIGLQLAGDDEDPDPLRSENGPDEPEPDGSSDYEFGAQSTSGLAT